MTRITNTENDDTIVKLVTAMGEGGSGIVAQEAAGQRQLINATQMPAKLGGYDTKNQAIDRYIKLGFTFRADESGNMMTTPKSDPLFVDVELPSGWSKKGTGHSMWTNLVDDRGNVRATIFYKAAFYDRDAFINFERRFSYRLVERLPDEERYRNEVETYYEEDPRAQREERSYDYMDELMGFRRVYSKPQRTKKTRTVQVNVFGNNLQKEIMHTPVYFEITDGDRVIHRSSMCMFTKRYSKRYHSQWWRDHDKFTEMFRTEAKQWLDEHFPNWNDQDAYWDQPRLESK